MKWIRIVSVVVLLLSVGAQISVAQSLASSASARADDGGRTMTLGFAGPLSNPVLQGARNGALLAVEDFNARQAGQRSQVTFSLLQQDDRSEVNLARIAAQYFVRSKVVGVVGHWSSDIALATAPIYEEHGVAQMMFTASAPQFTAKGYATSFRLLGSTDRTTIYLAQAVTSALEARRVAVVSDDSVFSRALTDTLIALLARQPASAEVVYRGTVSNKAPNFGAILAPLEQSRPDLIVLSTNALQARTFVNAASRVAGRAGLLLTGGAVNQTFDVDAGSKLDIYTLEPDAALEQCGTWKSFFARFSRRFGMPPSSFARYAYSAANVLMQAAVHADESGASVLQVLHERSFTGLSGDVAFDAQGNARHDHYTLYRRVPEGSWRMVQQFSSDKPAVCR